MWGGGGKVTQRKVLCRREPYRRSTLALVLCLRVRLTGRKPLSTQGWVYHELGGTGIDKSIFVLRWELPQNSDPPKSPAKFRPGLEVGMALAMLPLSQDVPVAFWPWENIEH